MTKRIFFAGLLGGLAMFVWSSVAHVALPLGQTGIKEIPNEPAVLSAMHTSLGEAPGMYAFPGMGQGQADMKQYAQKLAANPSGILIYHPPGAQQLTAGQLVTEFLTELIESLLVVFLLAQTRLSSFAARVGFVVVAGVAAALVTNVSYWNWYGFPTSYTAAYMAIQIVGFLCVGLVAGAMIKPAMAPAGARAAAASS
jgi:heme exporter protein D